MFQWQDLYKDFIAHTETVFLKKQNLLYRLNGLQFSASSLIVVLVGGGKCVYVRVVCSSAIFTK